MARKNMNTKAGKKQVTKRVHKKKTKMTPKKKNVLNIQAEAALATKELFDDAYDA